MPNRYTNASQITAATTADLVTYYNLHNPEKQIKKFENRAKAVERVLAIFNQQERRGAVSAELDSNRANAMLVANSKFEQLLNSGMCPLCGGEATEQRPAGRKGEPLAETHRQCDLCSVVYHSATGQPYVAPEGSELVGSEADLVASGPISGDSLGEPPTEAEKTQPGPRKPAKKHSGGSRGWEIPEVAEARTTRHRVKTGGKEYRSVREAFKALGLPDAKHIRFRAELKAAGTLNFEGHKFTIIND